MLVCVGAIARVESRSSTAGSNCLWIANNMYLQRVWKKKKEMRAREYARCVYRDVKATSRTMAAARWSLKFGIERFPIGLPESGRRLDLLRVQCGNVTPSRFILTSWCVCTTSLLLMRFNVRLTQHRSDVRCHPCERPANNIANTESLLREAWIITL